MAPAHPAQGRAPGHANAPEVGDSDRQCVRKIFQRAIFDAAGNGCGHELPHRVRRGQVVRTTPNSALIFPSFHVSDRFLLTGERVAGEAVEYVEPAKVSGLVHPRLCVSAYDLAADEAHSFFSFTMRSGGGGTLSASMPRRENVSAPGRPLPTAPDELLRLIRRCRCAGREAIQRSACSNT